MFSTRSTSTGGRSKAALASLALLVGGSSLVQVGVAPAVSAADPTAPTAPTAVSARAGVNAAKVYFNAPVSDGGAPVTGFTATSVPEGKSCTAAASSTSCYVSGLSNGQAYTFDVTATNTAGTSPAATTGAVIPRADSTDPVLVSSEVTPNRVSSLGGAVITVRLRITDDVSGRANPSGGLDANPAISFSQRTGDGSFGFTRAVNRVSGDEYDGVYQATVSVPAGTPAGDWDLTVYPIRDNAGNSTFFITRPGVLVGAPGEPTGVAAALDPTTPERDVVVTWDAPTDNGGNAITGYRVTDSHTGTTRTVTGAGRSWTGTFPDIDADEQLTFTVVTVNSAGTSNPSTASAGIVVPATAPTAPHDVSAVRGDEQAVVSWAAPASTNGAPVTSYTVTAEPGGSSTTVSAPTTSATMPGLTNGTAYAFAVTATNAAGVSPGATSAAVTPAGVPDVPTNVQASRGDSSASVTWAAAQGNGADVTGYTVTASPGGASVTASGSFAGAIVPGLTNGTAYTFTVTATNAVGTSASSVPSADVVPAGKPLAVTGVELARGDRRLVVSWTPSQGNGSEVTGYVVTYNGVRVTLPPTATRTSLNGLRNGTTYRVTVAAVSGAGEGTPSSPVAAVPAGRPGVVAKPVATVKGRTVTLTWRAAPANGAAISSYVVKGGKPAIRTVAGRVRKLVFKNLRPGTYQLRVTARNAVGSGTPSPARIVRIR